MWVAHAFAFRTTLRRSSYSAEMNDINGLDTSTHRTMHHNRTDSALSRYEIGGADEVYLSRSSDISLARRPMALADRALRKPSVSGASWTRRG